MDENGQYVELSGIPTRIWGSYAFPRAEHRNETVVYCGFLVNHWGHFLVEAVTRLGMHWRMTLVWTSMFSF